MTSPVKHISSRWFVAGLGGLILALAPGCFTEPNEPFCLADGAAVPGRLEQTTLCCELEASDSDERCEDYYREQGVAEQVARSRATCLANAEFPEAVNGTCTLSCEIGSTCECRTARDCSTVAGGGAGCLVVEADRAGLCTEANLTGDASFCSRCADCKTGDPAACGDQVCDPLTTGAADGALGICRPCDPSSPSDCPADAEGNARTCVGEGAEARCMVVDPLGAGEPCTASAQCQAGLQCYGDTAGGEQTCRPPCTLASRSAACGELACDCGAAGAPRACTFEDTRAVTACADCDPTLLDDDAARTAINTCWINGATPPEMTGCYPREGGGFACRGAGTTLRGATCTAHTDCTDGHACVTVGGTATATCQKLCDPASAMPCGRAGNMCVAAGGFNVCDCDPAGNDQCNTQTTCADAPDPERGFCQPM